MPRYREGKHSEYGGTRRFPKRKRLGTERQRRMEYMNRIRMRRKYGSIMANIGGLAREVGILKERQHMSNGRVLFHLGIPLTKARDILFLHYFGERMGRKRALKQAEAIINSQYKPMKGRVPAIRGIVGGGNIVRKWLDGMGL